MRLSTLCSPPRRQDIINCRHSQTFPRSGQGGTPPVYASHTGLFGPRRRVGLTLARIHPPVSTHPPTKPTPEPSPFTVVSSTQVSYLLSRQKVRSLRIAFF